MLTKGEEDKVNFLIEAYSKEYTSEEVRRRSIPYTLTYLWLLEKLKETNTQLEAAYTEIAYLRKKYDGDNSNLPPVKPKIACKREHCEVCGT